jgi:hypothetical protein
MFAFMIVMWGMPIMTVLVMIAASALFVGLAAPEYVFGLFSIVNGVFAYIFDLMLWLYPVKAVLVDKNGYEEVFHQDPGSIYYGLRGFLTGLPEHGKNAVKEFFCLIAVFEFIAFILLLVGPGRGKKLNYDTSAINSESMDGSWVMGKGGRRKRK